MENKVYIHPSANVSDKALIGEGTKVWINVQIRENARIGAGLCSARTLPYGTCNGRT